MNNEDRVWLARIDERTINIWRVLAEGAEEDKSINTKIDDILEGQKIQNGAILRNTIWRRVIIGIGTPLTMGIVGWLIKLTL